MSKGIIEIVKKNGKTIVGVVGGLAIAGLSLMGARKGSADDDYESDEICETEDDFEEDASEEAAEESSEE